MNKRDLIQKALEAREYAYCPYSGFQVGAALLAESGTVYTGCNIENAAFTPTNCAERTAFFKAVSEGVVSFQAIAITGKRADEESGSYTAPCGVCRQVMAEFCDPDSFLIILAADAETYKEYTLRQLLPEGFTKKDLEEE
ncbi:MAG: cytidine deaminase [Clostridiaceae bacterium]|nr:cytidine deaminase [Clostridiaceae bacterium]